MKCKTCDGPLPRNSGLDQCLKCCMNSAAEQMKQMANQTLEIKQQAQQLQAQQWYAHSSGWSAPLPVVSSQGYSRVLPAWRGSGSYPTWGTTITTTSYSFKCSQCGGEIVGGVTYTEKGYLCDTCNGRRVYLPEPTRIDDLLVGYRVWDYSRNRQGNLVLRGIGQGSGYEWMSGVNEARCLNEAYKDVPTITHPRDAPFITPHPHCTCGFYAVSDRAPYRPQGVCGVVVLGGKIVIRPAPEMMAQYARIVALSPNPYMPGEGSLDGPYGLEVMELGRCYGVPVVHHSELPGCGLKYGRELLAYETKLLYLEAPKIAEVGESKWEAAA